MKKGIKKRSIDKTKQWIVNQFCYGKLDVANKKIREFWTALIKGLGLKNK